MRTCTVYQKSVKVGAMRHEFIKGGGKYLDFITHANRSRTRAIASAVSSSGL